MPHVILLEVKWLTWINCCSFRNSHSAPAAWSVEGWSRVLFPFLVCWSISCTSKCSWFQNITIQSSSSHHPTGLLQNEPWSQVLNLDLSTASTTASRWSNGAHPGQNMWQVSTRKLEWLWSVAYWSFVIILNFLRLHDSKKKEQVDSPF